MDQKIFLKIIIVIWLSVCAYFDWKKGEVSNWLTIPPLIGTVLYVAVWDHTNLYLFLGALIGTIIFFFLNAMGGADMKVLSTLAGLWSQAFWIAVLAQGIWGLIVLLRNGKRATFRAIPAMAVGTVIGFIWILL